MKPKKFQNSALNSVTQTPSPKYFFTVVSVSFHFSFSVGKYENGNETARDRH